jgi:hypothetical protein
MHIILQKFDTFSPRTTELVSKVVIICSKPINDNFVIQTATGRIYFIAASGGSNNFFYCCVCLGCMFLVSETSFHSFFFGGSVSRKRRGAINAKQLAYLEKYRPKSRLKLKNGHKNACCLQ